MATIAGVRRGKASARGGLRAWSVFALLFVPSVLAAAQKAEVPPPAATPADVVVSGRTSTARNVTIVKVGDRVPTTYSGSKVKSLPGYTWYVSQHFALRSEVGEAESREYLLISELAYPHYLWVLGREPEGIETTRIAMSYSKNFESLKKATDADLGGVGWRGGGGGVTLNANQCAYNYPSGGLKYHKRDLVTHENLHAMQMAIVGTEFTPLRFTEGITHALANHVYDEDAKRLTVMVVDKPTTNNPFDNGLRQLEKKFLSIDDLIDSPVSGPVGMVWTQFCWTDPDRLMKWRLWRDELFRLRLKGQALKAADRRLIAEIFGPIDRLNAVWKAWVHAHRSTFHYVAWGWEQDADTLWSYGYGKHRFSQTDINYAPSEAVVYDPLRMDYPAHPMPAIVGPVQRGVAEPAVGCVADFTRAPGAGRAGLGLGVEGTKMLAVLIEKEETVVADGRDVGMPRRAFPIPASVRRAAQSSGRRYGLTLKLAAKALEITVRAGAQGAMQETRASVPLADALRKRLADGRMAIIAKDGKHGVTPFFHDARRIPEADLSHPAPPGRWRFAGDDALYRLYRIAFRLKRKTPRSLLALRGTMADAMDKGSEAQAAALAAWRSESPKVMRDLFALERDPSVEAALSELTGVSIHITPAPDATWSTPRFVVRVCGASDQGVAGSLQLSAVPEAEFGHPSLLEEIAIGKGETSRLTWEPSRRAGTLGPFHLDATMAFTWGGVPIRIASCYRPPFTIPCYWVIGPFRNEGPKGGGIADIAHPPERDGFDTRRVYETATRKLPGWRPTEVGSLPVRWSRLEADPAAPLSREFYVDLMALYGGHPAIRKLPDVPAPANNCAAYALVAVHSPEAQDAVLTAGAEDGLVAWLNGTRVHKHLEHRDYSFGSDSAPIRLKKGWNQLAFKITRGQWGSHWGFSACLAGRDGLPLSGLRYALR